MSVGINEKKSYTTLVAKGVNSNWGKVVVEVVVTKRRRVVMVYEKGV